MFRNGLKKENIYVLGCTLGTYEIPFAHQAILAKADVLAGGKKLVEHHKHGALRAKEYLYVTKDIVVFLKEIEQAFEMGKCIVVLAEGDPFYYGIGTTLVTHFPEHTICSYPSPSSLATLANSIGIPWGNIRTVSLHGRNLQEVLRCYLQSRDSICILTDRKNSTHSIAKMLCSIGYGAWIMHCMDSYNTEEEYIFSCSVQEVEIHKDCTFATIILVPAKEAFLYMGMQDAEFITEKSLITKQLVRASVLSLAQIRPTDTVWDIGGGSGALSIEASILAHRGQVCCIEKNSARSKNIEANIMRHKASIVSLYTAPVLEICAELPNPDSIIIGGGLHNREERIDIVQHCITRLPLCGNIVIPCVVLDTLEWARKYLQEHGCVVAIYTVQNTVSSPLGDDIRFVPQNPVYIIKASKTIA